MKIAKIIISNFKGIKDFTFEPKMKTGALIGKNGLGKTSFLEAIRFALTGTAPEGCIHDGETSCTVSIILDDGTEFSRTKFVDKPAKVTVNGKTTTGKSLDSLLETLTGVDKDSMKVTTSSEVVEGLKPAEFGDFIMNYVPEEINIDTLLSYIPAITLDGEFEVRSKFPAMPATFGIDEIKGAYNAFYDTRKSLKREIEARNAKTSTFFGTKPTRTFSAIESELTEFLKLEGGIEAAKTAEKMYNAALAARKTADKEITELEAQIATITATKPVTSIFDDLTEKEKKSRKAILDAEKLKQTIADNIFLLENTLVNLSKPVCPISEKLICTTDKTAIREELTELVTANKEGIEIQNGVIEDNKKALDDVLTKKAEYSSNEALYKQKVLLNTRLEKMKKSLPAVPKKPEIIGSLEVDYSAEIRRLQKERDDFNAYAQYEKTLAEIEVLKLRYSLINDLVDAFSPKGCVITSIMNYYMSIFEDTVNERAKELRPDFLVKFIPENGVQYLVKTAVDKDYRDYSALSHGEQVLAMFLVLDMLNSLAGTRMMLLDDLNHLDKASIEDLLALMQSTPVQDSYDHIFVASVDTADMIEVLDKHSDIEHIL